MKYYHISHFSQIAQHSTHFTIQNNLIVFQTSKLEIAFRIFNEFAYCSLNNDNICTCCKIISALLALECPINPAHFFHPLPKYLNFHDIC